MSFAAAIKAWEEKALLAANQSVCNAFEQLGVENVTLTSYGRINIGGHSNGDIANNWYVTEGSPSSAAPNGPDLSGSASLARIRAIYATKPFYRKDSTVYLTNVMNYSYRANWLGWPKGQGTNNWIWSGRVPAGYGFIGTSLNNLKGKYL